MNLQWEFITTAPETAVRQLSQTLAVPPIIARIMLNRGLDSMTSAREFFNVSLQHLHDPFLMADMQTAVERLAQALAHQERLLIYGDYDVDGTTATALSTLVFRTLGYEAPHYIPERLREGYGLSMAGIEKAHAAGVDLILAVDCGVTAHKEIQRARELGIDVIVCDHHQPAAQLPPANALLNPKRNDCPYPFKELCGVGVVFKLMQGLFRYLNRDEKELYRYLDLVAIGSAADIVPLVDENRIFVKHGLEQLNRTENTGLRALVQVCGLQKTAIDGGQVLFIIAPRINAVGRMGDARRAVSLLISQNENEALEIAQILDAENRERRSVDDETFREAVEMIQTQCDPQNDTAFVLHQEHWHPGVIGIVASRVVEKYFRPTVMIATANGMGKGSVRSIPGFDIYRALSQCADLLLAFGGHKYAAGLTIETEQIPALRRRLQEVAGRSLTPELLAPKLRIDGEIRLPEIETRLVNFLKALAPYGPQNMRPVFVSRGVRVSGAPQIVGNNHLRFHVKQDNKRFDCIGFGLGEKINLLNNSKGEIDLAYLIEENTYQGRTTLQLRIKDIR
ncbi:MAG: single-stranded-DNA-specific exonuclease RecJ [candidate division KSB1 bacterium]|nr:single-stranded-DNA-specific exonuclease RecJ [candidate division KSB1 bacterium]MDZ7368025.1 single-stranded-DNA-specific exonuclease RecJ [candidate division KSB1 bacterium]MDZ7405648.1 single-stranded-DNA-specific exonuclease RecJ [candidate division KSB1 bacterium]